MERFWASILALQVNSLDIIENKSVLTETDNLEDPVKIAINKFENYPNVLSIKRTININ